MNQSPRISASDVLTELSRMRAAAREARFVGVRFNLEVERERLLLAAPMEPSIGWSFERETELGFGVAVVLRAELGRRSASLTRDIGEFYGSLTGSAAPRIYGGFTFEPDRTDPRWPEFGVGAFIVPRYRFRCTAGAPGFVEVVVEAAMLDAREETDALARELEALLHAVDAGGADREREAARGRGVDAVLDEPRGDLYRAAVVRALAAIETGEIVKVVVGQHRESLGFRSPKRTFAAALREDAHARFMFCLGKACFVGATPELLVRVVEGTLEAQAVAGSRRVGEASRATTPKEAHEHALVAEFIADRLGELGCPVRLREREVRRFGEVEHFVTLIEGEARRPILELLEALHPTPALAGAPTEAAVRILRELEGGLRGPFGAPFGWIDAEGQGHFVVGIRSVLLGADRAWVFAGAGIVSGSEPVAEWEETELKLSVGRRLLASDVKASSVGFLSREVMP